MPILFALLLSALVSTAATAAPARPADLNLGPKNLPFRMDFAFPKYAGVDDAQFMDLQVIHHQLVIVGNDYTMAARRAAYLHRKAELDAITTRKGEPWGKAKDYAKIFDASFQETYNQYENLDKSAFFTITSSNDAAYATATHPARVTRYCTSRGNFREYQEVRERVATAGSYLANYSYVFLPSPLHTGDTYTITQGDGRKATFVFDEDYTVSRSIKVNQSGYSPQAKTKYAYLGAWQAGLGPVALDAWQGKPFAVVDANTRKVVFTGTVKLLAKDPRTYIQHQERAAAGEDIYQLDLSGLAAQGEFYIRIAGLGRSWPFYHGQNGPGRAFYIHLRGLFHQRAGHELQPQYTGWPRPLAHAAAYESDYSVESPYNKAPIEDFDAIKYYTSTHPDKEWPPPGRGGVGGWYDAADYDRRWFHYDTVYDLLIAYELAPRNFTDGQENTYESHNGIPDILDEVAWGLLIWRNSQNAHGGVSGHCEQRRHPNSVGQMPDGRPHHDPEPMYFSAATRESSLRYAAAAAHLARLLAPFNATESKGWLDSAQKAYKFGIDPANHYRRANYEGSGKPFEESQQLIDVSWCLAALELYVATHDKTLLDKAIALYPVMKPSLTWPISFVREDYWWAFYPDKALPENIRAEVRANYIKLADEREKFTHEPFYRNPIDPHNPYPTTWGKATGTYDARYLLMGWGLTHEQKYFDAAALCADWVQGCNPLGMSWTSGIGYNYPWCFFSCESEEDGILDPVPGMTVYGIGGGLPMGVKMRGFNLMHFDETTKQYVLDKQLLPSNLPLSPDDKAPSVPYWRGWAMDYHDAPAMQEYTVWETISPCVLVYGVLMGQGWMPDESLKHMQPREAKYLIGLWPTP